MNRQNFESKDRFPLSTQALTFMQDMIMATAQLALIGGNRYILSGCLMTGNSVSDGIIVIDGEIISFRGGIAVETITIMEEVIQVSANGLTFENARVKRYAKFATGSGVNYYPWADFKPLQTNKQLEEAKATIKYVDDEIAKIQAGNIPAGVIVMWSGAVSNIPKGWQLCDGSPIGNTGKYTPNLSGRFVVGYSPEASLGYTSLQKGNKNPDQYTMTLKKEHMPAHNHGMPEYRSEIPQGEYGLVRKSRAGENVTISKTDSNNAGSEPDVTAAPASVALKKEGEGKAFDIRPPYYVIAFIIKTNIEN